MLSFFVDLVEFIVQAIVIVVAILVVIAFIFSLVNKSKDKSPLKIKTLNKSLKSLKRQMQRTLLDKKQVKQLNKQDKKAKKNELTSQPKAFVLSFDGDIKASAVEQFREEVTAVLMTAKESDQVIVKIESPGGVVHGYGLAASQLQRIKDKKIPLIACVDKIAASGGYMMASVADQIYSAPFAIIGSIGVVASMPNFSRFLEKKDVDYLEITAGEFKRTLTPLGKITDQGMSKFKEQIEDIHTLFKNHVSQSRPQVDISKVATGEYWFGIRAKELNLVDKLQTSDDYITQLADSHHILEVSYEGKKSFKEKLAESMQSAVEKGMIRAFGKLSQTHFM